MAGSGCNERHGRRTVAGALVLGALLVGDALGGPEPFRAETPVRRLGGRHGYVNIGGVTKPVLAPAAGTVELDLRGVPRGRLHVAAGIAPGERQLSGRFDCSVSITGPVRETLATLPVVAEGQAWAETVVALDAPSGARLTLDCPDAGAARGRIAWAQPLLVPEEHAPRPPLIVVVSLDTLRADHVSGFGAPAAATPALARLGREGMRFVHTQAEATWTVPSHFSLFYGRLYGFPPATPPAQGLAQLLADRGYVTAALTGGGFMSAYFRFHLGFDRFAEYDASRTRRTDIRLLPSVLADAGSTIAEFDGAPLFLFVHTYAVHQLTAKENAWLARLHPELSQPVPNTRLVDQARRFYGALVGKTDRILARLLLQLRKTARERPVLLVVMSDHGEAFGEHHNFRHGDAGPRITLHQEVLHVPLIVWGPSLVVGGTVASRTTMLSDIAPSILAAAGIPKPDSMTGENLWPLWSVGASAAGPVPSRYASVSRGAQGWALHSPTRKLILELCDVGPCRIELYATARDPFERQNLVASHPRAVAALIPRLSSRVAALTGVIGMGGMPPVCTLCSYDQMGTFWDRALAAPLPAARPGIDAATRERLRALGYLDR